MFSGNFMKQDTYTIEFKGTTYPLLYVTEVTYANELLERLNNQAVELTSIDTETEALPKYRNVFEAALKPQLSKVRLLQVFTGRTVIVFDIGHLKEPGIFTEYLERGRFIGHHSVYDLQFFYRYFIIKSCNIGCTMLAAKLLFHALRPTDDGLSASLKNLSEQILKVPVIKEMGASDWSVPELTWEQIEYAGFDAIYTYFLAKELSKKIEKYGLFRIYNLYKEAQHPIAKMQLNGIKLDVDSHRDLIVTWRAELFKARKEVQALTGLKYLTSTTLGGWLEKTLPSETLAIWPRTEKTKRLKTDSHVFADFSYLDIVKPFSEFKKRETLCTSFGNNLINQVSPETNRLHAQYKLAGARTGRLSCANPNLQQLPRDNSVRKNFISGEDNVFVCADYSQIELRVAAELSRDSAMLQAYRDDVDLHKLTASLITKKSIKDVTKEDRQMAKAFNFGLLFGLGAKKFVHYAKKSYGAELTNREATGGVETFRRTYSGYRRWQLAQAAGVLGREYVETPCGKRRSLDIDNSYGASMNTPIQGGASECMLYALVRLNKMFTSSDKDVRIVNCVHDEIMVECPPKDVSWIKSNIEEAMELGFLDVFPSGITRGLCECKSGINWAEAK